MNAYRMSMLKISTICNEKKSWTKFKINDIVIKKEVDVCFIWEMKYLNKECINYNSKLLHMTALVAERKQQKFVRHKHNRGNP